MIVALINLHRPSIFTDNLDAYDAIALSKGLTECIGKVTFGLLRKMSLIRRSLSGTTISRSLFFRRFFFSAYLYVPGGRLGANETIVVLMQKVRVTFFALNWRGVSHAFKTSFLNTNSTNSLS